jgi:internalin A
VIGGRGRTFPVARLLGDIDLPGQRDSIQGAIDPPGPRDSAREAPDPPAHRDDTRGALNLFFSYSHKDAFLKGELGTHLKLLERIGKINSWSDLEIGAGENWEEEIMNELERADIILLLVSADFFHSDFCYDRELKRALERHRAGDALALPIIVRDCSWTKADFAGLQVLPEGGKAVSLWDDRDSAWRSAAEGIEQAVERFGKGQEGIDRDR